MNSLYWIPLLWGIAALGLLWPYRHWLRGAWREPCWRRSPMAVEMDDWGAGPAGQAAALDMIREALAGIQDRDGRSVAITLGVILESADGTVWRTRGEFRPVPMRPEVRDAMATGVEASLFHPQLHGACHFWPPAVVAAATEDPAVNAWLAAGPERPTEELPDPLQSRWIDGSRLPAGLLPEATLEGAAEEEARAYRQRLGRVPVVAVPTTFIWGAAVERGWARAGVGVVVTPGRRFTGRDAGGRPVGPPQPLFNGQRGAGGVLYLVRDLYFEPLRGHRPEDLWVGLAERARQCRPALVETHRINFLDPDARSASVIALRRLYKGTLDRLPETAFLSPEAMAEILRRRDPQWLDLSLGTRVAAWWWRVRAVPGLARRLRLLGLAWPLAAWARHLEGTS